MATTETEFVVALLEEVTEILVGLNEKLRAAIAPLKSYLEERQHDVERPKLTVAKGGGGDA